MITLVPTGPNVGLNDVIDGVWMTVNVPALVAVPPAFVTEIVPVVAPAGTVAVIDVAELTLKLVAEVPLNLTELVPPRFVPPIVTAEPTRPLVGVKPVIVGGPTYSSPADAGGAACFAGGPVKGWMTELRCSASRRAEARRQGGADEERGRTGRDDDGTPEPQPDANRPVVQAGGDRLDEVRGRQRPLRPQCVLEIESCAAVLAVSQPVLHGGPLRGRRNEASALIPAVGQNPYGPILRKSRSRTGKTALS